VGANSKVVAIVRWIARGFALAVLAFLAFFFVGEGGLSTALLRLTLPEKLGFLFMACIAFGNVGAIRWERVGGAVSLAGLVGFCSVELSTGHWPPAAIFLVLALPGAALFALGCWFPRRKQFTREGGSA
jgi:hypothetical protein